MDEDHFTDMEDSFTESDETSWGDKIGGSIVGVVLGVVLFFGSFPFLFWNEGRAVDRYKVLKEGESVVVSISSDRVDPAHEGRLVHASGRAETEEILEDPEMGVSALAVKLERNVEMYQWREKKKKKDKKTTYSYSKTWSSSLIDSSSFRRSDSHRNPGSMPFQSREIVADNVTLGEFTLSGSLIRKIDDARPLAVDRAESLPEALGDEGDFYGQGFYIGQDPDSPRIGDVRITFRVVRPTEVSLVAKQTGDSFAAYRTESGGSIELLEIGALDARGMFKSAHQSNTILTWALRIGGSIAMLIGLFLIFGPLSALADIIPFLGGVVQFGAVIVALLLTCVLSTLTIGAAWVFYRPVLGISLLVFGVALTAVIIKLGAGRGKPKAAPRPPRMTGAPTPPPPAAEGAAPSPPPGPAPPPPRSSPSPEDTMKPSQPAAPLPPQRPRTRPPSAAPAAPPPSPDQTAARPAASSPTPPSLEDTLPPAAPASPTPPPPSMEDTLPPITPAAPPKPTENDWLAKGKAHFAKRNFQDALSAFSKAIEINANFAAAYFDRGVVFTKLGANRRAVDDLKAAARLNHKKARDFLTSKKIPW